MIYRIVYQLKRGMRIHLFDVPTSAVYVYYANYVHPMVNVIFLTAQITSSEEQVKTEDPG